MSEEPEPVLCAYYRLIREGSVWTQDPPEYEECDSLPVEGSAYCRKHTGWEDNAR